MILTEKETMLLKDIKTQEGLCVEKYAKYGDAASATQLKNLFQSLGKEEQEHLNTINQMLDGTVPPLPSYKPSEESAPSMKVDYNAEERQKDTFLCSDTLGTEKHVSSVYNTGIFEFKSAAARDMLNHIQKEEQEHGKKIYDFMSQNGMY